jgi:hypothetical protein
MCSAARNLVSASRAVILDGVGASSEISVTGQSVAPSFI